MLAITAPLRSALADWYQVPTGSMKPTILEGDRILVNNLAYGLRVPFSSKWITRWSNPRRGEIVTLSSPADHKRLVKRVIAVPGDQIALRDNHLILNGRSIPLESLVKGAEAGFPGALLAEEALPGRAHEIMLHPGRPSCRDLPEMIIPAGRYFVMGDNRDDSLDSRYFGFVDQEQIMGRASHVVASFNPDRYYLPRSGRWMKPLI